MIFNIGNKKIFFLHIPKCAGTSVENELNKIANKPIDLDNANPDLDLLWGQYEYFQLQHLTMREAIDRFNLDVNNLDLIFTVVREPISRLLSEVNWQLSHSYFQYDFSLSSVIKGFLDRSEFKFCHYKFLEDYLSGYEDVVEVYDISSMHLLERRVSALLGVPVEFNSDNKNSQKFFTWDNLSPDSKSEIEKCFRDDVVFYENLMRI